MAGMNLILKRRSVHKIAHFLNCGKLLSFGRPASASAGMLQVVWSYVILQAGRRPSRGSECLRRNPFERFLRSAAVDHFLATAGTWY